MVVRPTCNTAPFVNLLLPVRIWWISNSRSSQTTPLRAGDKFYIRCNVGDSGLRADVAVDSEQSERKLWFNAEDF